MIALKSNQAVVTVNSETFIFRTHRAHPAENRLSAFDVVANALVDERTENIELKARMEATDARNND
jgi:hypothetical protein